MDAIQVLYGERVGDKKHIIFHQSFGYTFKQVKTEEDIENCITEVEAFLREVLKTKTYENPLYRPYKAMKARSSESKGETGKE